MRSTSGLILSGTENGVAKSYTYDKADRLTNATIGSNTFAYGFGAQAASCSVAAGYDAGKDSNRTSYTLNGQTTTYCYNSADQLISSSDARFTNAQYDTHGNTVSLGDATHKTEFGYDALERNTNINETAASSTRETSYQRDVTDRVMRRTYKVDGTTKDDSYYGFTGSADSPSFLTDTSGTVTQKYLNLAGGVNVTIKPQSSSAGATTYSLSNMHGDTMATVNADGTPTIVKPTGPFGEKVPDHQAPTNAASGTSNDYLGAYRKANETDYLIQPTQMGARVYIAELGRFMQIDPIEGGTPNAYVYPTDPVNGNDLSGKCGPLTLMCLALLAAASALTVASASKNLQNNPKSVGAWVGMGMATAGVGALRVPTPTPTLKVQSSLVVPSQRSIIGSRQSPVLNRNIQNQFGNTPTTINGRQYTGHGLNSMQNGGIYPSVVENTIKYGMRTPQLGGTFKHYDAVNDITVITGKDGQVITTYWGGKL